jgi:CheY-like chemotaxis protein
MSTVKIVDQQSNFLEQRNACWLRSHQSRAPISAPLILIAEDSETDIFFLFHVMEQAGVQNPIFVVRDGGEALEYMKVSGKYAARDKYPLPGIVLLDLKLPGVDGFEILRWRQTQSHLQQTLMVAVSSYDGVYAINLAYEAGADTFLSKPLVKEDILNLITGFEEYWELVASSSQMPKK